MIEPSKRPRALLFDMDGTLTEPMLDYPLIKREMGIVDRPILEALADMDPTTRQAAEHVLFSHEERAARESTLNPGCKELLEWVRSQRFKTALITRNSRASVNVVVKRHGLALDHLITREDGKFKPHPEPLLTACTKLAVSPDDAWMIGDGEHDIEAGNAAGIKTVWLSHGRERTATTPTWRVAKDLWAVLELLQCCKPD